MSDLQAKTVPNPSVLAKMIDISAVQANSSESDVRKIAKLALEHQCVAAFALPGFTPLLRDLLDEGSQGKRTVHLGGTVGFPSGCDTTKMKAAQAKELLEIGCDEIDMVINIGKMLSGRYDEVLDDMKAVRDAVGSAPMKVILECHYYSDDQIVKACELAVEAGTNWVKTGTGWAPTGATLHNVALMKKAVGNAARIKAAGGVRTLQTVLDMIDLGVERFGIGGRTVTNLFSELDALSL